MGFAISENDSAIGEFLAECDEIISRVSANLGQFEKGVCTPEILDELYRDIHTMKGSSQLFNFRDVAVVAHSLETCLDPIRKRRVSPNAQLLDAIFKCMDLIEGLVKNAGSDEIDSDLKKKIDLVLPTLIQSACRQFGGEHSSMSDKIVPTEKVESVASNAQQSPSKVADKLPDSSNSPKSNAPGDAGSPSDDVPKGDTTIRVQVGLLDSLMNLIGEMVLVRNQVLQYSNRRDDLEFLNLSQRLDLVTSDLQDQVMKTRMQPIGNILTKFQRVIRDLSKELGKQIDLTIQGKDTELDKTLLEAIKDPLTHIVRNSCDHGIEKIQERKAAGKPETGHILIRSFHEGGQVIIEISDDGKGLSRKRILQKALEKGLISADKAETLSDRDILNLIFLPGFSTAEQVSAVSGRGVGMDVVRTNIERIGGSVDLESVENRGTTIRLRIPLTLAIVPAMLVSSDGVTYAIPQVKLVELVRVEQESSQENATKIQWLQGKPVYELRGRILPLVDLKGVLNNKVTFSESETSQNTSTINIVVLSAEDGVFGLIVDEVMDTADIVVKPLTKFLKSLDVYSAATILGTGNVALIIDPIGIAKRVNLSVEKKQEGVFLDDDTKAKAINAEAQEYLLFKVNSSGNYAVPLCMVNRLEEFASADIEYSGEQPIVQYRNAILPLLDLNKVLGFQPSVNSSDQISTIVVQRSGKAVGLKVDAILDVATIDSAIDDTVKDRFGILGNLISTTEVITVIDVLSILEKESNKFAVTSPQEKEESKGVDISPSAERLKVLYAEDVAFFRKQVSKLLTSQGFDVITAPDGKAALQILQGPGCPSFSLILSDIEMPHLNGYQLAREIRQMESLKKVPLVALTTRFNQKDIDEGMKAGFDCYLEKLNPELLMEKIRGLLSTSERKSA